MMTEEQLKKTLAQLEQKVEKAEYEQEIERRASVFTPLIAAAAFTAAVFLIYKFVILSQGAIGGGTW